MFGVQKGPKHALQKPVLESPMAMFFLLEKVHHRMRNETLGKFTKFGDPRPINKYAAHEKPAGGGGQFDPLGLE